MSADLKLASPGAATVARALQPGQRPGFTVPTAQKEPRFSRQQLVRWTLFALLPLALIAGASWYVTGGQVVSTDDAYVQADTVGVSTDISGIVQSVDVTDNQHVSAGQVLYHLDPKQFQIALDNAKANLAQVALTLQSMKQDYRRMLSDVDAEQAQVNLDQVTYDRDAALLRSDAVSKQNYDQAHYTLAADKEKIQSLQQQAQVQLARLDGNADIPVEQLPAYQQAQAQVDEAQRQLDHTVIKAPFSGIVTNVPSIAPGKYLAASTTAFYLVDTDHLWVEATPRKENRADLCAAGATDHGNRRHLSRRQMARDGREHQPGGGAAVLAAAGAEYERQLGEGRAADRHAGPHRSEPETTAAARRHERRAQRRYRSHARPAALRDRALRR